MTTQEQPQTLIKSISSKNMILSYQKSSYQSVEPSPILKKDYLPPMENLLEGLNDSYQEDNFMEETPKSKVPQTDPKQRSRRNFNSLSILDNKLENRLIEDPLMNS